MKKKYIVVGGVAGGATAAARLRRLDEKADIMLIERGRHDELLAQQGKYYELYTGNQITQ